MSTGQIFFYAGLAGIILSGIAGIVCIIMLRREKQSLQRKMWSQYKE